MEYRASCMCQTLSFTVTVVFDSISNYFRILCLCSYCLHHWHVCTYILEYPPSQHGGSEVTFMVVSSVVFCEPQEEQKWGFWGTVQVRRLSWNVTLEPQVGSHGDHRDHVITNGLDRGKL